LRNNPIPSVSKAEEGGGEDRDEEKKRNRQKSGYHNPARRDRGEKKRETIVDRGAHPDRLPE